MTGIFGLFWTTYLAYVQQQPSATIHSSAEYDKIPSASAINS